MRKIVALVAFLLAFIIPGEVFAQAACSVTSPDLSNALNQIDALFQRCTKAWEATLGAYALRLFWLLAAIEFAWSALRLALRDADFSEWLAELVNQIFFLGIFLALLTYATEWTGAIVESFSRAADGVQRANGFSDGSPSSILNIGIRLGANIWHSLSFFSAFVQSVAVGLCGIAIVIVFALIAAAIVLAQVESYIVLSAGVLLLGFGGSRWTKEFALKTVVYAVSVGAKLFLLKLIAGLGAQIIGAWSRLPATEWLAPEGAATNILVILGSTIVLWVLVKSVPDMIQGLINGSALGVNTGLAASASQLAGAAYALGMATRSAYGLSGAQREASEAAGETQPASWLGCLAGATGRAGVNAGQSALNNIGNRLSGRAVHGYRLAQMAKDMDREADALREDVKRQEREAARSQPPASEPPPSASPQPTANDNTPPQKP